MAQDHEHNEHKRKSCDHKEHDHKEHDHKEHNHKEHDHKDHDHKAHDHKDHEHKEMVHGQDKSESNSHSHSHDHDGDCDQCPAKKMKTTSVDDVKDVDMPEWKKKALAMATPTSATDAPFGGSWNTETSVDAKKDTSTKAAESAMDTGHDHGHSNGHGHTHEHMDHPGNYSERPSSEKRDYSERSFTVGLGGPVGSGKTALMLALCKRLREKLSLAAVTNDIFTREDGEFLTKNEALPKERIVAVETGGCPHAAIREDISANLHACEQLTATFAKSKPLDVVLLESGGDNLAANFSPELADFTVYVIDVAGGDKVPRKGGPGVTQSDVLVINKTDLAKAVGASLEVMERDAKRMRGDGPTVFAQAREGLDSTGVDKIMNLILDAWRKATSS